MSESLVHEIGSVLIGLALAIIAGILAAQGRPLPDWVTFSLGVTIGWFFRTSILQVKRNGDSH